MDGVKGCFTIQIKVIQKYFLMVFYNINVAGCVVPTFASMSKNHSFHRLTRIKGINYTKSP